MPLISADIAQKKTYDICIVGAGAAGLAVGFSTASKGLRVLVVDRGELDPSPVADQDDEHLFGTDTPHDPREKTNCDAVGGTLHRWGGRCVPFDPQDFGDRSATNEPGWPIHYEDYAPWISLAAEFLQSGDTFSSAPPPAWRVAKGLTADRVEHLNDPGHVELLQKQAQERSDGPDIVTRTVAQMVSFDGGVGRLTLRTDGEVWTPAASQIILASGGLETTRLLLIAQHETPNLFGGADGPLGRHYMGHLTGSVGDLHFSNATDVAAFAYTQLGATQARRRIMLDPESPQDWANTAFWVENRPAEDPSHRSGELSFKHLLSNFGSPVNLSAHLRNIATDPTGVPSAIRSALRRRLLPHGRYPNRLITRGAGPYRLCFHAEQLPLPSNRVQLSNAKDRHGLPKLKIDFHYDQETIWALVRDHRRLAHRLSDAGLATLTLPDSDQTMAQSIAAQSRDGYHQIGLTRMALDPTQGVVDPTCRVHGTKNLFVASAAVFPVSGQANPTLSVVAFALRLAEFLCETHKQKIGEPAKDHDA